MSMTIHDYISYSFKCRGEVKPETRMYIEEIHNQVIERMTFGFPLVHFDSYNIQSAIVSLPTSSGEEYYNLVDHSMVKYICELLCCLEMNHRTLMQLLFISIKKSIATANGDEVAASNNYLRSIFLTERDLDIDEFWQSYMYNDEIQEKLRMMFRFHFLHEYAHFLTEKPLRAVNGEIFMNTVATAHFDKLMNRSRNVLYKAYTAYHKKKYMNDKSLREEINCDLQAALCLLELSDTVPVQLIMDAVISYLLMQYAIVVAKNPNELKRPSFGSTLRIGMMVTLAEMLGDKETSAVIAKMLNQGNRYLNLSDLFCEKLSIQKYQNFLEAIRIIVADDLQNR